MMMSNTSSGGEKLERKVRPNRYCPTCLGYGVIPLKNYRVDGSRIQAHANCPNCWGSGWVYEDK